jgi:hypothetical protein
MAVFSEFYSGASSTKSKETSTRNKQVVSSYPKYSFADLNQQNSDFFGKQEEFGDQRP